MFARLSRPVISGTNGATALHIVKKELISFFINNIYNDSNAWNEREKEWVEEFNVQLKLVKKKSVNNNCQYTHVYMHARIYVSERLLNNNPFKVM